MSGYALLKQTIRQLAENRPLVAVSLSGGVDSSLLAAAALDELGHRAVAFTVVSPLVAAEEIEAAQTIAADLGIGHRLLTVDVLALGGVRDNGPLRCYYCKEAMFQAMFREAGPQGLVCDGTNADDDSSRPGLAAARESGVVQPLFMAGLGKGDIRGLARNRGLPNWERSSNSCLATRIEPGVAVDMQGLRRVEAMERSLRTLGVFPVRARHDNLMATIAILPQHTGIVEEHRGVIAEMVSGLGLRSVRYRELTHGF